MHLENIMVRPIKKKNHHIFGTCFEAEHEVLIFDWEGVENESATPHILNPSYDFMWIVMSLLEIDYDDRLVTRLKHLLREACSRLFEHFKFQFLVFSGRKHLTCKQILDLKQTDMRVDELNTRVRDFVAINPFWCVDDNGWPPSAHTLVPNVKEVQTKILRSLLHDRVPLVEKLSALYLP